jgi:hypothetical protein
MPGAKFELPPLGIYSMKESCEAFWNKSFKMPDLGHLDGWVGENVGWVAQMSAFRKPLVAGE